MRIGSMRAWLLALLIGGACSPSFPIPPPEVNVAQISLKSAGADLITLEGTTIPDVTFYAYNRDAERGVITATSSTGAFKTEPFAGKLGDVLELYYVEADGSRSLSTCPSVDFTALVPNSCPQ